MIAIMVIVIIFLGLVIFYLLRKGVSLAAITILINFGQYLYIMNNMELQWPPLLSGVLSFFGNLSFSLDVTAPECLSGGAVSYYDKFISIFVIPLIFLAIFVTFPIWLSPHFKYPIFTIFGFIKKLLLKTPIPTRLPQLQKFTKINFVVNWSYPREKFMDNLYLGLKMNYIAVTLLYVNIANMGISYFSCRKIQYGDTTKYFLVQAPDVECYNLTWYAHLPIGVLSLIFYILGIPVIYVFFFVTKEQKKFKTKAWENCRYVSNKILTGSHNNFKPGLDIFIPVQLFLKLFVILTNVFFANYIGIQAIAVQVCLTLYLVAIIHYRPYKEQHLNMVETFCDAAAVLALGAGLLYYTSSNSFKRNDTDKSNELTHDKLGGLTIAVAVVIILAVSSALIVTCTQTRKMYKQKQRQRQIDSGGRAPESPISVKIGQVKNKAEVAKKKAEHVADSAKTRAKAVLKK
eukprot:NODE_13_length_54415_cov_0.522424.p9 type:complete len:460 gc:universal NODE_13_length_54415_cov_0.522424:51931-50552(-)